MTTPDNVTEALARVDEAAESGDPVAAALNRVADAGKDLRGSFDKSRHRQWVAIGLIVAVLIGFGWQVAGNRANARRLAEIVGQNKAEAGASRKRDCETTNSRRAEARLTWGQQQSRDLAQDGLMQLLLSKLAPDPNALNPEQRAAYDSLLAYQASQAANAAKQGAQIGITYAPKDCDEL